MFQMTGILEEVELDLGLDRELDLGTLVTSLIFLGAILATVIYLTVTHVDRTEDHLALDDERREPVTDGIS